MFNKVEANLDFLGREKEVLAFWKKNDIFKKSLTLRDGCPDYTFYDGPPTANGKPHIGHVLTRAMKDLIPRYRTMKGYSVLRKAGWDTHGLPVELEVEKQLGLDGKEQIEQYGIEPFIKACKESVWKYLHEWEEMSDAVGYWCDMEHPYVTYHNDYIESEWWAMKQIYDKGLLYKGHKVVPYCPRCGTALSSHEVAQGYKNVKEKSAFVRFRVKGTENEYLWAWTTTPWTLPSNVALCVNPDEDYTKFRLGDEVAIMADALMKTVLGDDYEKAEKLETVKGQTLVGMEYEPLWDAHPNKKAYYVVSDGYVTLTDGVGIVHIAPAFGEDDSRVGHTYDLPFVQLVDAKGCFTKGTKWEGRFVKDCDPDILAELRERGNLIKAMEFAHDYPFCWRCDTPLLYYARETWFIKMTAVRDQLIANNRSVNWMPENIKEGRMGNFLENVIDWGISRERYWGTPLPIWICPEGHMHVIGSIKELREMGHDVPENIELHRPYIDAVTITCPHCGKSAGFTKEEDTLDGWFDSGSTHFAAMKKDQGFWPATMYLEGLDQYRGWFQSSLLTAVGAFGEGAPFKECVTHGWTVDGEGRAMHKSLGNGVDPADIFNENGADILRLWAASADYHADVRCSKAIFQQLSQNYLKFRNTCKFMLDNLVDFDPAHLTKAEDMPVLDRWLITKLNELIEKAEQSYRNYEFHMITHAVNDFCVTTLSSFYLDIVKDRLYCEGAESATRRSAQTALYLTLHTLAKLFAPILAFTCDEIWLAMPHTGEDDARNVVLNEMNRPFAAYALDSETMARWERIIEVRALVNGALEEARAAKVIGKSLEADVHLTVPESDRFLADENPEALADLFIVSKVELEEGEALRIKVDNAAGTKCPRCWKHSLEANAEGLCPRCAAVVKHLHLTGLL